MTEQELKLYIKQSVESFKDEDISQKALALFSTLGYNTDRRSPFSQKTFQFFKDSFLDQSSNFNEHKALVKDWKHIDLLFQISKDEIVNQLSLFNVDKVDNQIIESYLFFTIELFKPEYTRTALAQITREINKVFPMPVMILFKHGNNLTLSVINRRLHKKDERKDVLEKVTLIKDISIDNPHRAHIEILFDLSFQEINRKYNFTNFVELHNAWQKTLDTKELNKRFYRDLSNWYFWAMKEVLYPGAPAVATLGVDPIKDPEVREHNAKNLIRLLTRILFVWFIKEKNLIPDELFDENYIKNHLLNDFEPRKKTWTDDKTKGSKYYRAILQNLFFATLNQAVNKREFRKDKQHMNVTNLMRYESYFKDPKVFLDLVESIVPFMNGGLFECLDSPARDRRGKKGGDFIVYEDGFSDRPENVLCVPDYIFFGIDEHADLSEELGDKKQKNVEVKGLINILKSYKFTVTENTPIEEDIALDPELLGRVFENLLASYNPETKTTARKQTGSFYTPREIVNYMVDESLKAYLKQKLETEAGMKPEDADVGLEFLVGYYEKEHLFNEEQTAVLIKAIDKCKILDPACGSGAFPMGILHKLVHILHKLDPNNEKWKERQIENAQNIDDSVIREHLVEDIETAFSNNELDYGRKLYLIENCIYGVDIQPIATQISKLRFFISLIVDQRVDKTKDNFGIRPLPNLETKFVAANTLIGIEKPKQQLNLFDNQGISELEEKLKDVRHRLFSAKTPKTKRELRDKDNALREQMSDLLVKNGWGNESAQQLAAWDPYDQNATSPFFDSKWMFEVNEGFDIVIGNPPYGIIDKNYYLRYAFAKGNNNSFSAFTDLGLNYLLNATGILSYIVPNTWLGGNNYKQFRINSLPYISKIIQLPYDIFEAAYIDNVIVELQKIKKHQSVAVYKYGIRQKFTNTMKYSHINSKNWNLDDNQKIFLDNSIISLLKHYYKNDNILLKDICQVQRGTLPPERSIIIEHESSNSIRWFNHQVYRYKIEYSDSIQHIIPTDLKEPKPIDLFVCEKILGRQLMSRQFRLQFMYFNEPYAFKKNIYAIYKLSSRFLYHYLLGILNSKFLSFIQCKLNLSTQRDDFPAFSLDDYRNFRIPNAQKNIQELIAKLTTYIIYLNEKNALLSSFFESIIDYMVYELYFPEEIKSADAEVLKHLHSLPELKESYGDQEKLVIIEQVYKELSDPAHPVSIAMEKMKTVPEVRIIEGLDN